MGKGKEEDDEIPPPKQEQSENLLKKYDIPVEHLSFEYVKECNDSKEIERIVRILRSGEEGCYPDLTRCAEERLGQLKPRSRLLYDPKPVTSRSMLGPDERKQLDSELDSWTREMRTREYDLEEEANQTQRPPIPRPAIRRSPREPKLGADARDEAANAKERRRLASCDYAAWDRYDAETEVSKIDLRAERELAEAKRLQERRKHELASSRKEVAIEKSLLTGTELSVMATREREKGNEAFRAGDYAEALQLYTTSIAMDCDIAAYNNRAMTHIKLRNYEKAIKDCQTVLEVDSMNVKALLRRALAFEHLEKSKEAIKDYEAALNVDPNNKTAIAALNKLKKYDDDTDSVRLTIEEIYD
ncbi:hypothetical protein TKK_0002449 [Trichogramma kaykai]|uniref:Sperm-associated antigen 1 n=1 Tax=Trichogramma kaykai TaxID=54128 RepID=A0ABD2VWR1_9HYME